jgi:hypothetical protein
MGIERAQLNNALVVYLGGGQDRGVIPYGQEERVRAAFPESADELLAECKKVIDALDCDEKIFQTGDLIKIGDSASERIKKRFGWLESIVADKLGNYYSYQMR